MPIENRLPNRSEMDPKSSKQVSEVGTIALVIDTGHVVKSVVWMNDCTVRRKDSLILIM